MLTLDAVGFDGHAPGAPSSLPAKQPNGSLQLGQPVPTYSTVLLRVWPHVVTVSVPPSAASSPRCSANTTREPGKNVLNPFRQEPAVYMPGVPTTPLTSAGTAPRVPDRGSTLRRPRQTGGVAVPVALRVVAAVIVPVSDVLPVALCELVALVVEVLVCEGVPERVADCVGVPLRDGVDAAVPVRVPLPDSVMLREPERDAVLLREAGAVAELVREALTLALPESDGGADSEGEQEGVTEDVGEADGVKEGVGAVYAHHRPDCHAEMKIEWPVATKYVSGW